MLRLSYPFPHSLDFYGDDVVSWWWWTSTTTASQCPRGCESKCLRCPNLNTTAFSQCCGGSSTMISSTSTITTRSRTTLRLPVTKNVFLLLPPSRSLLHHHHHLPSPLPPAHNSTRLSGMRSSSSSYRSSVTTATISPTSECSLIPRPSSTNATSSTSDLMLRYALLASQFTTCRR